MESPASMGAPEALVRLAGISKSFGPVQALREVDLAIFAGETHFILGENGAGKSTLMRILAGIQTPDSGDISIRGTPRRLRNRKDGIAAGIGIVQQHHGLVHQITGVENFLLSQLSAAVLLRKRQATELLLQAAAEFELEVRPNRLVSQMAAGERQRLEIVIALASGSDLIILDEPTSALPSRDIDMLIAVVRRLKQKGKAVAYITHKLREVLALADQVTILRRGEVVDQLPGAGLDIDTLTEAMIGTLPPPEPAAHYEPGPVVARLRGVATRREAGGCPLADVDLSVRAREIVGVAGMAGNGQDELAEVLAGLRAPTSGVIETKPGTVAYIPEDRAGAGIAEGLTIRDNCIVHRHRDPAFQKGVRLDSTKVDRFAADLLEHNDVRAAGIETPWACYPAAISKSSWWAGSLTASPTSSSLTTPITAWTSMRAGRCALGCATLASEDAAWFLSAPIWRICSRSPTGSSCFRKGRSPAKSIPARRRRANWAR